MYSKWPKHFVLIFFFLGGGSAKLNSKLLLTSGKHPFYFIAFTSLGENSYHLLLLSMKPQVENSKNSIIAETFSTGAMSTIFNHTFANERLILEKKIMCSS